MAKDFLETHEFAPVQVKFANPENGVVKGIAATYDSNPDRVGDTIKQGAFTNTLNQIDTEGRSVVMLDNHDPSKPIGRWTKFEDGPDGLKVEGRLSINSDAGRNVWALMKDGVLDALSIGYRTVSADPRAGGGRVLTEIDLVEISVVTFPANRAAVVTDVKGDDPTTKAQKAATGGANDMALDASELDTELKKANERIADLEAKFDAVPAKAKADETPVEVKAFENFARHGKEGMAADEIKALNSGTDAQGGFLVPEDFRAELIRDLTEVSPMRQVARVTTTGRDELVLPKRLTKLAGGWTAELADRTESEPTYGQIKIPVHEIGVFTAISNMNLEDSAFDMQAELTADFAESFGEIESNAFIVGDGVGKPKGILDSADIPTVNTAAAGVIDGDDLIGLFYSLKASYRNSGAWMMNSQTLAAVRKLKTAGGDYIWRESLADGQPATILGRPVYEAPDMPDPIANAKAVAFGDFSRAYRIVTRLDISVLRDPYSLATKSMVRFHARARVGGDVVQGEAARTLTQA
ncbi:phage major capsid protein [uncultured Tateyamaria sp.]|uniref:phage major capsid protein n=1 Tax=Tateyamaria sp. 1078 TaxID=3417464 RepID=UPI0026234DC3|nr:phage major capsid protein [uncultured Tateyamaria sp.]